MSLQLYGAIYVRGSSLIPLTIAPPPRPCRSAAGAAPDARNAFYYAQRADAGLVITEATIVSEVGRGFPGTPGVYSKEQVAGWKLVTDAVHAKGGLIFCQLWHCGRVAAQSLTPGGAVPVGPSDVRATPEQAVRALATEEIAGIVEEFRAGAANALEAGFDGVEVHSANGYLLDQFLHDDANTRTDAYGGSIAARARLLLEVTEACVKVWGADRVGVRLSPSGHFNAVYDSAPKATFSHVATALGELKLAYLHVVEPRVTGNVDANPEDVSAADAELTAALFKPLFQGPIISAGGHNQASGEEYVASGKADAIAYGRAYLSNPDLVTRFKTGAPLTPYDRDTFYVPAEYGGYSKGYIWPAVGQTKEEAEKEAGITA